MIHPDPYLDLAMLAVSAYTGLLLGYAGLVLGRWWCRYGCPLETCEQFKHLSAGTPIGQSLRSDL